MIKMIKIWLQIIGILLFCRVCELWESRLEVCDSRKGPFQQAETLEGRSASSVLRVLMDVPNRLTLRYKKKILHFVLTGSHLNTICFCRQILR
jgi:hypothetical protein